jgi:transcriptional regulator with XRE-family HTH domain
MDHAESHPDCRILLKTLRSVAKAKKYTSSRLAKSLRVSEVTVKRWFSGQTCSLRNIFDICEILGISFFDLASLAKKEEEVDYVLSEEQEHFFSLKPALFGVFKRLHRGEEPKNVARDWNLTGAKFFSVLRKLEKQDLLEVLPGDRIRVKARGNIRYSHRGPLAKVLLRPQILHFLDHTDDALENDDVCMHSAEVELSESHIAEFVEEIHALGAKYRARAYRDQSLLPSEKLKSVRWLFVFAPYQTNWHRYEL